jgi:hypothetical protein
MTNERPSPFTIPEPAVKFAHGPPAEPKQPRSMTVEGLIRNLTVFADFYEQASAGINSTDPMMQPFAIGTRDANADDMQRQFRVTPAIDRVRAYVLAQFGADLTIGTAQRLLGDLIRRSGLAVKAAEVLTLEVAMDRLESNKGDPRSSPRRLSVNARMLETIQTNPDAMGWNSMRWARHLKCAKSSVVDTQTWKDLKMRRERERAERTRDRRRRANTSDQWED